MTDQSRKIHLPGQPAQAGVLLDPTGATVARPNGQPGKTPKPPRPGLLVRVGRGLFSGAGRPRRQRAVKLPAVPSEPAVKARWERSRVLVFVAPLVAVNTTAVVGQVGWAYDHLHIAHLPNLPGFAWAAYAVTLVNLVVAVLFAATLESIGLYLSAEAHAALLHRDPALKLRLASYGMGLIVGGLNFSHYAARGLHPTTEAVAFGLLSASSPWLWAIRSRSRSRTELVKARLIDERAAHFSTSKWINFPVKTWKAFRLAVDLGKTEEREAWEALRLRQEHAAADAARRAAPHLSITIWPGAVDREPTGRQMVDSTTNPTAEPTSQPTGRTDPKPTGQATADPTVGADRTLTADSTAEPTARTDRKATSRPDRKPTRKPTTRRRGSRPARGDYEPTLVILRQSHPSQLPKLSEVEIADGNRSRGRAVEILKRLKRERGISDEPKERAI